MMRTPRSLVIAGLALAVLAGAASRASAASSYELCRLHRRGADGHLDAGEVVPTTKRYHRRAQCLRDRDCDEQCHDRLQRL